MIEGIHSDIACDELKKLIQERIDAHNTRADFYLKSKEELERNGFGDAQRNTSQGNPLEGIKSKISEHQIEASYLSFVKRYLVDGEVYRLSQSELKSLGFITGYR